MKKNNICSLELSELLRDFGFNETCNFSYIKEYGVRKSIIDKHPRLSDCGYQDLTKEYGGDYEENEVYEHNIVLIRDIVCDNSMLAKFNQIASAPHIYDAKKWVEEKFKVIIQIEYHYSNSNYTCDLFESERDEIIKMKDVINNMVNNSKDLRNRYFDEKDAIEATIINFLKSKTND